MITRDLELPPTMPEKLTPAERFAHLSPNIQATLLRIGRRVSEGFEGEIVVAAKSRGVNYIRWVHTERGDVIRDEL